MPKNYAVRLYLGITKLKMNPIELVAALFCHNSNFYATQYVWTARTWDQADYREYSCTRDKFNVSFLNKAFHYFVPTSGYQNRLVVLHWYSIFTVLYYYYFYL